MSRLEDRVLTFDLEQLKVFEEGRKEYYKGYSWNNTYKGSSKESNGDAIAIQYGYLKVNEYNRTKHRTRCKHENI